MDPSQNILTRDELLRRYARPRSERVVFTNGCFDILHRGHVAYLTQARALGERLVVGINTDDSVRRLKGAGRPVVEQDDRAYVLAALTCVDAVTLFDEDTPQDLIEALLPDILVKGGDYSPEQVVGRDVVESHGGRLVLIPFVEGRSTTRILHRIQKADHEST
ncbi:MAG TPA: D-glycero-beta-D-manno-heptose 1-phosphate adenylyltransferase [Longimicrobiales bacterium]|nr:D-glycero-beta-D-manno-heptose 1-phosphate adenylyltransferase [Longimicrobiales bacterium]